MRKLIDVEKQIALLDSMIASTTNQNYIDAMNYTKTFLKCANVVYDVDEVVDQLYNNSYFIPSNSSNLNDQEDYHVVDINDAIEIVKGGIRQ